MSTANRRGPYYEIGNGKKKIKGLFASGVRDRGRELKYKDWNQIDDQDCAITIAASYLPQDTTFLALNTISLGTEEDERLGDVLTMVKLVVRVQIVVPSIVKEVLGPVVPPIGFFVGIVEDKQHAYRSYLEGDLNMIDVFDPGSTLAPTLVFRNLMKQSRYEILDSKRSVMPDPSMALAYHSDNTELVYLNAGSRVTFDLIWEGRKVLSYRGDGNQVVENQQEVINMFCVVAAADGYTAGLPKITCRSRLYFVDGE